MYMYLCMHTYTYIYMYGSSSPSCFSYGRLQRLWHLLVRSISQTQKAGLLFNLLLWLFLQIGSPYQAPSFLTTPISTFLPPLMAGGALKAISISLSTSISVSISTSRSIFTSISMSISTSTCISISTAICISISTAICTSISTAMSIEEPFKGETYGSFEAASAPWPGAFATRPTGDGVECRMYIYI